MRVKRDVSRTLLFAVGLLPCLLGAVIYSNSLSGPFVFDDTQNIRDNPLVRVESLSLDALWRVAAESDKRPVAMVSFALNHRLGGYAVEGYHCVNVLIHLINGLLVYVLAAHLIARESRLSKRPRSGPAVVPMALLAAAIFVAHPLQTQAVTYIVQRMSSLATMFYLGAFLLFVLGRRNSGRRRWALWLGCALSWLLALGSKEIAITLPAILVLYEWFFERNLRTEWLRTNAWITLAAAAVTLGVAVVFAVSAVFDYSIRPFTLGERVLTEFRVVVSYLGLLIDPRPSQLSLTHDVAISRSLFDPPTTLLAMATLAGLLTAAVGVAKRHRLVSFCILWFFANLALESSIIPLELMYEHRLYLPMFGFALLSASWVGRAGQRWPRSAATACVIVVALLGAGTYARNETWRDEITLWSDTVAKHPHDERALNNLGSALEKEGRDEEALVHFVAAVASAPDYARARNNLGIALQKLGRLDEAIAQYQQAVRIDPDHADAEKNLASAFDAVGEADEAIRHYRRAVRIAPGFADAHFGLAAALARAGRIPESIEALQATLRADPDHTEARRILQAIKSSAPAANPPNDPPVP